MCFNTYEMLGKCSKECRLSGFFKGTLIVEAIGRFCIAYSETRILIRRLCLRANLVAFRGTYQSTLPISIVIIVSLS